MFDKLKRVKFNDLYHLSLFLLAWPVSLIYKKRRDSLWLICEYKNEARDNSYYLFKYIAENHKNVDIVYAISPRSRDYERISRVGKYVKFGSFKHWVYYLSALKNISTQKGGKPNAAVCYLFEVKLRILRTKRYFLQHGVTMNNLPYLYYPETYFKTFSTSGYNEYKFICDNFGYPSDVVKKTGMCRFDNLIDDSIQSNKIVIMPTWRQFLYFCKLSKTEFQKTSYYLNWSSLLKCERFQNLIQEKNYEVCFILHRNMSKFSNCFNTPGINIYKWDEIDDFQSILRSAKLLITDYSSLSIDFSYMKKPLIYFQFDLLDFQKAHLHKGYFEYREDGFGPVCESYSEVIDKLIYYGEKNFCNDKVYLDRICSFFLFNDRKNCERNYYSILNS